MHVKDVTPSYIVLLGYSNVSCARICRRKELFQPILQYLRRDTIVMLIHVLVLVKVSSRSDSNTYGLKKMLLLLHSVT